jgi:hypothetical protein|tara:strand:+ start:477 stop:779 length:303 start_codon:yes stop_codon:yes gene_type:complete
MLKYYIALFLIVGIALYYVFITDPCNRQLRLDFSSRYPDYEILFAGAGEGSAGSVPTSSVQCHVTYEKPDSNQIYEDIWLYQNFGSEWTFSTILSTEQIP